jgi:hypothetical protein
MCIETGSFEAARTSVMLPSSERVPMTSFGGVALMSWAKGSSSASQGLVLTWDTGLEGK